LNAITFRSGGFLIAEYEEVKAGRSATFRRVGDFYRHHGSGSEADLLPRRRGPKCRERRTPEGIKAEIIACRERGMNRYEIHAALRERRDTVPVRTARESSSTPSRV
jgi:hypothetical protein